MLIWFSCLLMLFVKGHIGWLVISCISALDLRLYCLWGFVLMLCWRTLFGGLGLLMPTVYGFDLMGCELGCLVLIIVGFVWVWCCSVYCYGASTIYCFVVWKLWYFVSYLYFVGCLCFVILRLRVCYLYFLVDAWLVWWFVLFGLVSIVCFVVWVCCSSFALCVTGMLLTIALRFGVFRGWSWLWVCLRFCLLLRGC